LDDNWTFDQPGGMEGIFYHQWVTATDGNPNDPNLVIDPFHNQYQLVPKGGNPNDANWQLLYSGGKH